MALQTYSKSVIRAAGTRGPNDKGVYGEVSHPFAMIDNYVYSYHTGILVSIPTYPRQLADSMSANYQQSPMMSRSAPIFSYSNSGPRTMQIDLELHRDMMGSIDYYSSGLNIQRNINSIANVNDDYIDVLIREIQALALPRYDASQKMVDPPMVAVRFGNEVFIKGVVNGNVGVTYSGPILTSNKYAKVDISFNVAEVDPYDADAVM